MNIAVAIVEDQNEIRESLATLIRGSFGYVLAGSFESAEEALPQLVPLNPDVVLVDIHLPGKSGIELVSSLKKQGVKCQFLMCTSYEDTDNIFNALKAGATGYLLKTSPPTKILEAITDIANGGAPMSAQIARKVVASFSQPHNKELEKLTEREQEILDFLSKGYRYKEIGDKLFLSTETVRKHISNIYQKLHVNSRTEALNKVFGR